MKTEKSTTKTRPDKNKDKNISFFLDIDNFSFISVCENESPQKKSQIARRRE